jgi:hypothetical protein
MLSFAEIKPGALVDGLARTGAATVLHASPLSDGALEVAWRDAQDALGERIYPILGQRYGHEDVCAAALLATTAVSFVTVSWSSGWPARA